MEARAHKVGSGCQLSVRAAAGATIAYVLAKSFVLPHPVYALIAAIGVTDFYPTETRNLGLQRLAATIIGAACGLILWTVFEPREWVVGLGILIAMATCHVSNISGGAKVAGYVSALVLLSQGEHPWTHTCYRVLETVLGIGVAWLISLVPASSIWMNPVNAGLTNLPPRDLAHCAAHYSRVSNVSCWHELTVRRDGCGVRCQPKIRHVVQKLLPYVSKALCRQWLTCVAGAFGCEAVGH
jgi:aromatic acid exporter family member 1